MSRYQQLFAQLAKKKEGAFVPFVTLGDPSAELSLQIVDALVAGGADALEIGLPFSDPLADGPTIQAANLRAIQAEVTPTYCFTLLTKIRQKYPDIPIGLLVYANLVYNKGIDQFYALCATTGVDSVLIADVPFEESQPYRLAAIHHNIAPIFICPPNADDELIEHIATHGQGYTYLLSRAGVTGTETRATNSLSNLITKLTQHNAPPPLQGFGISEPEQVRVVLSAGASGAISGSAVVKLIEQYYHEPARLFNELTTFVSNMKAATRN